MEKGNLLFGQAGRWERSMISTAFAVVLLVMLLAPAAAPSQVPDDPATTPAVVAPVVDQQATEAAQTSASKEETALSPELLKKMTIRRTPRLGEREYSTTEAKANRLRMPDFRSSQPIPLARYSGTVFTTEDLSKTLALRKPKSMASKSVDEILSLSPDEMREVVRDLVYEKVIYGLALKEGITPDLPEIKERLDRYSSLYLNRALMEREVEPRVKLMDEKSAREYYEEKKSELYTRPESFLVEEIFLSDYRPYISRPGDTGREIARRVSGDEKAYTRILRDDDFHFPRFAPADKSRDYPPEDLHEGEKLLVPLSRDEETSKAKLAADLRARLVEGDDFEKLARMFSEADRSTSGTLVFQPDLAGIDPAIRDAIASLRTTTFTQVVRGNYGWSIFKRYDYKSTSTMSFAEVRQLIAPDAEAKRRSLEEVMNDIVDQLGEKHGLKIQTEILKRPDYQGADPLTADTPIATAPGFTYTLEQFRRDMVPTTKSWTGMTFDERLKVAKTAPSVLQYLVDKESRSVGLDKTPQYQAEMESKAIIEVTSAYLRKVREKRSQVPTDNDLRKYYADHVDRYTSPAMVTIREITKRVDLSLPDNKRIAAEKAARDELLRVRNAIKSQADFEQQARRQSESLATRSRGGLIGTVSVDFRGEMFKNQIMQLKPGQVSEPFLYGAEMVIVRLDKQASDVVHPFEEVYAKVKTDYLREMPAKLQNQERDAVLKEAGFQLLF